MFDKLEAVEKRYEELTKMIADPEVISNQAEWQKAIKEHAAIEEVVAKFREYKKVKQAMEEAEELSDRIGIMANGKLVDIGTSKELIKKTKTKNFEDAFVAIATGGEL